MTKSRPFWQQDGRRYVPHRRRPPVAGASADIHDRHRPGRHFWTAAAARLPCEKNWLICVLSSNVPQLERLHPPSDCGPASTSCPDTEAAEARQLSNGAAGSERRRHVVESVKTTTSDRRRNSLPSFRFEPSFIRAGEDQILNMRLRKLEPVGEAVHQLNRAQLDVWLVSDEISPRHASLPCSWDLEPNRLS